jgi:hypothetical protein
MNIDVEIYIKNFINFFEKNPNDLMELIGEELKEVFYEKVKELCYKNFEAGVDHIPTKTQLIDIVVSIKKNPKSSLTLDGVFIETKYGLFSLN